MCGRGGTGRRATLRSLWAKARGSSSLLDRTNSIIEQLGEPRRGVGCWRSESTAWRVQHMLARTEAAELISVETLAAREALRTGVRALARAKVRDLTIEARHVGEDLWLLF